MTPERAEIVAEQVEDQDDPIAFYVKMQDEWEQRWDFTPGDEFDEKPEEWNSYLDSIEGVAV